MQINLDFNDPHQNYLRLIQTKKFLESGNEVHDRFYEIHIPIIRKYLDVLEASECNQDAAPLLRVLITQYECFESFELKTYLEACNRLLNNVAEISAIDALENMCL